MVSLGWVQPMLCGPFSTSTTVRSAIRFSSLSRAAVASKGRIRSRRELLATGETVRKRTVETLDELTPQEVQVARLAADGQSNPEIGAQLFLSLRTVEWYLTKMFGKLRISSRKQLRSALSNVGQPSSASSSHSGPGVKETPTGRDREPSGAMPLDGTLGDWPASWLGWRQTGSLPRASVSAQTGPPGWSSGCQLAREVSAFRRPRAAEGRLPSGW